MVTDHLSAHRAILFKSELRRPADTEGVVNNFEYSVVSSANINRREARSSILLYEKSDWSRAFNQFTIACELDMINAISAADITFIMSTSMSAWLLSPLECSPQKQNG